MDISFQDFIFFFFFFLKKGNRLCIIQRANETIVTLKSPPNSLALLLLPYCVALQNVAFSTKKETKYISCLIYHLYSRFEFH